MPMYDREFSTIATTSGPDTREQDWWKRNQFRATEFAKRHSDLLADALYGEDPDLHNAFLESTPKEMAVDALYTFGVKDFEEYIAMMETT